jgi:type IV secretion system protein VirB10
MRLKIVVFFLIASISAAQTPTLPQAVNPAAPSDITTVPMGTLVALNLITSIKSKSTRPGDPVRAVVAFPLAIGTRVAIPAGTFVEGVVDKVNAHPRAGGSATAQLRFTRLLFANGYSVPLVATNVQAKLFDPDTGTQPTYQLADARDGAPYLGEAFTAPGQNPPPLPPLPSVGPSPGTLAGIGIGAGVGILVLTLVIGHHHASSADFILFEAGWQFQMTLQEPLTLDPAQTSAAAAMAR